MSLEPLTAVNMLLTPYIKRTIPTVFLLFTYLLSGQSIEGKVLDLDSHEPLENVNIYMKNPEIGTSTDAKGYFRLNFKSPLQNTDSLSFSILGYKTLTIASTELHKDLNIVLISKQASELDEVTISADLKLQSKLKFKKLSALKNGVFAFGSIILENKIYLVGGDESYLEDTFRKAMDKVPPMTFSFSDVQNVWDANSSIKTYDNGLHMYEIDDNIWQTTKIKLENRAYHQVNEYDGQLYIMGGKKVSMDGRKEYLHHIIEIVSPDSLSVIVDNTNPHQAVNFASFVYKDNLIVMGGSTSIKNNGVKVFTDSCRFLNLETGYWYELEKMITPKETNGVLIGNKIYLIGGFDGKPLSVIESLDLDTGQWAQEGDLFFEAERPGLTYHDDLIYIFDYGRILIYDTKKNTLEEYEIDLYLKNSNLHYYKNKLFIVGGYRTDTYSEIPSAGLFTVDLSEFIKTKIRRSKKLK